MENVAKVVWFMFQGQLQDNEDM